MAGGLVSGGFLVTATMLAGQEIGSAATQVAIFLWALGLGAGFAHGALLGYLARDRTRTRQAVFRDLARALLWVVPGAAISLILTVWISITAPIVQGVRPGVFEAVVIFGTWIAGLIVLAWAVMEGVQGLMAIYRMWPDLRLASVSTSVLFALLLTAFLVEPPQIWFTNLRVTGVGAVALAFVAAIWIALPVVILVLAVIRIRRRGS